MKAYYRRTAVGMATLLAAVIAAAVLANSIAADAQRRYARLMGEAETGARARTAQHARLQRLEHAMQPVRGFAAAWAAVARLPEKEAAERIQADLEAIAQRQLSLVTDGAITPQPERYLLQGVGMRVQRVTLRASGNDLAALLAWLGRIEERYPAALVESCEFGSNVGGNTGLTLRLVQPLAEAAEHRLVAPAVLQNVVLAPDAIAMGAWSRYLPTRLKGPHAAGFPRNPLQPAIAAEQRMKPAVHGRDDPAPRLQRSLDGHVRSVIRGGTPLIVVDGHVFRVGDEVFVGPRHDQPVPQGKTKLKRVGEDQLVFQVWGGTAEGAAEYEVAYALPLFLKAR